VGNITSDSMAAAQSPFQDEGKELLERTPINGSENEISLMALPSYEDSTMTHWKLYGSHFLSAWGERMWEFAVGLVLLRLQSASLFFVAAQGVFSGLSVVVAGGILGSWVDRTDRLTVACQMLMLQNAAIVLSGISALFAMSLFPTSQGWVFYALILCTMFSTALSSVASFGSTLSVEREWTKQLCGDDSGQLARLNASMRRIDLCCLILSPLMVGIVMTLVKVPVAIYLIIGWNLVAWAPECLLLKSAQSCSSLLKEAKQEMESSTSAASRWKQIFSNAGWKSYLSQDIVLAAFSMTLLYLTVLSLGLLMTAFLNWKGMSEAELSIYRGLGAVSGVAATFAFPTLQTRVGLDVTGIIGIWFQLCCLLVAVSPLVIEHIHTIPDIIVIHVLTVGLVASRFGLWLFDLTINQMLQERVAKEAIGAVSGVQGSLCSLFTTLSFAAGMVVWDPNRFVILMYGSCIVVMLAASLYFFAFFRRPLVI